MQNTIPVRFGPAGSPVNPMVYGQFIEHLLNCIDGGIYDPDSQFADAAGTRTDVLEKAEALQPPILRFPGGTVMCLYHWEDAIGPLAAAISSGAAKSTRASARPNSSPTAAGSARSR